MQTSREKFWLVVPAAGVGRRMADETPKQYLALFNRTVIEWSLAPFLSCDELGDRLAGITVALAADDSHWQSLSVSRDARIQTTLGGTQRANSVMNALSILESRADFNDWVLVHDAARPCLSNSDLKLLVRELAGHAVGGILASRVIDTLKRATSAHDIDTTVPRDDLWRALTPQMFRFGLLRTALQTAFANNSLVTDESSAIESLGKQPRLIEGRADNIKITLPEDLQLAEQILRARHSV